MLLTPSLELRVRWLPCRLELELVLLRSTPTSVELPCRLELELPLRRLDLMALLSTSASEDTVTWGATWGEGREDGAWGGSRPDGMPPPLAGAFVANAMVRGVRVHPRRPWSHAPQQNISKYLLSFLSFFYEEVRTIIVLSRLRRRAIAAIASHFLMRTLS